MSDISQWHPWFAWHPILDRWSDTKATVIWLEEVERRWVAGPLTSFWQYRPYSKA